MYWNYYSADKQITFSNALALELANSCTDIKDDRLKLLLTNDLIQKYTSLAPVSSFNIDKYGKPFLADNCGFYVNFSHSDSICVSVLSTLPCGIDIQGIKPYNAKVADKYFSSEQLDIICAASKQEKDLYYTEFWTQFEAVCKCDGRGISRAFPDITKLRNQISTTTFWDNTHSYCVSIATPLY